MRVYKDILFHLLLTFSVHCTCDSNRVFFGGVAWIFKWMGTAMGRGLWGRLGPTSSRLPTQFIFPASRCPSPSNVFSIGLVNKLASRYMKPFFFQRRLKKAGGAPSNHVIRTVLNASVFIWDRSVTSNLHFVFPERKDPSSNLSCRFSDVFLPPGKNNAHLLLLFLYSAHTRSFFLSFPVPKTSVIQNTIRLTFPCIFFFATSFPHSQKGTFDSPHQRGLCSACLMTELCSVCMKMMIKQRADNENNKCCCFTQKLLTFQAAFINFFCIYFQGRRSHDFFPYCLELCPLFCVFV